MADVQIKGLTKTYGAFTAVSDMTLDVQEGEFLIFLGPSGCGKQRPCACWPDLLNRTLVPYASEIERLARSHHIVVTSD